MKIAVIGGSGLIGSKLVTNLREQGHEASCRISQIRRQYTHGRGTGRSAEGRVGGR